MKCIVDLLVAMLGSANKQTFHIITTSFHWRDVAVYNCDKVSKSFNEAATGGLNNFFS